MSLIREHFRNLLGFLIAGEGVDPALDHITDKMIADEDNPSFTPGEEG